MRREMQAPHVEDTALKKLIERNYKSTADVVSGSTADAVRYEKQTGLPVKGKFHTQKAQEMVGKLEEWISQNPNAITKDKAAAGNVLSDLKNALGE